MGVPGLWKELEPAGKGRSLTHLAVTEGFEANPDGKRGFRVGIDASIWFFHAEYGKEGENPELRTMFFRCATLMHAPFLPLFVFDGKHRPNCKRGKRIYTGLHKLTNGMKEIVESFGYEWRVAPGEAEAELAYLNRIGVIDGVLSDDVDNFLFGARTVIRNPSNKLSGNRANPLLNADGKDDNNHSRVFRMEDIENHPDIGLTRGDLILIGLCSGGDYDTSGITGCGPKVTRGLIRYGLGRSLYEAAKNLSRNNLQIFLHDWRTQMRHELRTDSKGYIGRKQAALAGKIPDAFPDIDILLSYVNPLTSESLGRSADNLKLTWAREPDLGKLAKTCEFYFEWGYRNMIIKRFKTVIWQGAVLRILRRGVLELESRRGQPPMTPRKTKSGLPAAEGTPSKMIAQHFSSLTVNDDDSEDEEEVLITKITRAREHASTDKILEYRLEIHPQQLVRLAESGIQNIRRPQDVDEYPELDVGGASDDEETGKAKKKPNKWQELSEEEQRELELKPLMVWMPATMVRIAEPRLVREWEEREEAKRLKKAGKGTGAGAKRAKGKAKAVSDEEASDAPPKPKAKSKAAKSASGVRKKTTSKSKTPILAEQDAESSSSPPPKVVPPKAKKASYVDVSTDDEDDGVLPTFSLGNTGRENTLAHASASVVGDPFSRPRPPPGVVRDLAGGKASSSWLAAASKPVVRDLTTKTKKPAANTETETQADMKNFFPLARALARKANKATPSAPPPLRPLVPQRQQQNGVSAPATVREAEISKRPFSPSKYVENENDSPSLGIPAAKPILQPFPLSFDDRPPRRRRDSDTSETLSSQNSKSPRKSREHTSPRKNTRVTTRAPSRSLSPTPTARRPTIKNEVIDISSDEELGQMHRRTDDDDIIVVSD
ncbi:hypothetical protein C8F01DRAFT_19426 [Mycena amicta]|nr:hypothetical protein C8F01DRAFT_19426 [Mycena amicta]